MNRFLNVALIAFVAACPPSLRAQPPPAAVAPIVPACSLVAKEEVKKHLPWLAVLDSFPIEEEPIGTYGSSCNYPSVLIQVLPFSQSTIDSAQKRGGLETISGVGDEAYLYNNANQYAELYVKAGKHLLTLQANMDGNIDAVKPGVLNLAKALVEKLR